MRRMVRLLARVAKTFFLAVVAACILFAVLLFMPLGTKQPLWGVNFSSEYAKELGLDWQETYDAILQDLRPKAVRIAAYWDSIEMTRGEFYFSELDWQMDRAEQEGVKVILAIGMKVPRWPECHIPLWAWEAGITEREQALRTYMRHVVERYRNHTALWRWQVENEPYVHFGICPERPDDFLINELQLVASQDDAHQIVVHIIPEALRNNFSAFFPTPSEIHVAAVNIYIRDPRYQLQSPLSTLFLRTAHRLFADLFFGRVSLATELQAVPSGSDTVECSGYPHT